MSFQNAMQKASVFIFYNTSHLAKISDFHIVRSLTYIDNNSLTGSVFFNLNVPLIA